MQEKQESKPKRRKIDPLFLERLDVARGFHNFDMRAETMEASFVTRNSVVNSSMNISDINRSSLVQGLSRYSIQRKDQPSMNDSQLFQKMGVVDPKHAFK